MGTANILIRSFIESHLRDAAVSFEKLELPEAARIIKNLPARTISILVERLTAQKAGIILKHLDPAQSSSIFLTTVTDVVGFAAVFMPLLI